MTRLRKMMLEELQRRNYSEITTRKYPMPMISRNSSRSWTYEMRFTWACSASMKKPANRHRNDRELH